MSWSFDDVTYGDWVQLPNYTRPGESTHADDVIADNFITGVTVRYGTGTASSPDTTASNLRAALEGALGDAIGDQATITGSGAEPGYLDADLSTGGTPPVGNVTAHASLAVHAFAPDLSPDPAPFTGSGWPAMAVGWEWESPPGGGIVKSAVVSAAFTPTIRTLYENTSSKFDLIGLVLDLYLSAHPLSGSAGGYTWGPAPGVDVLAGGPTFVPGSTVDTPFGSIAVTDYCYMDGLFIAYTRWRTVFPDNVVGGPGGGYEVVHASLVDTTTSFVLKPPRIRWIYAPSPGDFILPEAPLEETEVAAIYGVMGGPYSGAHLLRWSLLGTTLVDPQDFGRNPGPIGYLPSGRVISIDAQDGTDSSIGYTVNETLGDPIPLAPTYSFGQPGDTMAGMNTAGMPLAYRPETQTVWLLNRIFHTEPTSGHQFLYRLHEFTTDGTEVGHAADAWRGSGSSTGDLGNHSNLVYHDGWLYWLSDSNEILRHQPQTGALEWVRLDSSVPYRKVVAVHLDNLLLTTGSDVVEVAISSISFTPAVYNYDTGSNPYGAPPYPGQQALTPLNSWITPDYYGGYSGDAVVVGDRLYYSTDNLTFDEVNDLGWYGLKVLDLVAGTDTILWQSPNTPAPDFSADAIYSLVAVPAPPPPTTEIVGEFLDERSRFTGRRRS